MTIDFWDFAPAPLENELKRVYTSKDAYITFVSSSSFYGTITGLVPIDPNLPKCD